MSDADGGDSFTEITSTSWFGRIGQSFLGVLFGIVLILGSAVLLFWNEGRAVQTARSLAEGEGIIVAADAGQVDAANDGKLVHVSGDLKTTAPLTDPELGVSAKAARLVRTVEMYQWKEESHSETRKNFGGSEEHVTTYKYIQAWSDSRIDSAKFKQPDGHANPQMRYRRFEVAARDATLGAFRPSEAVLAHLAPAGEFPLDPALQDALRQRAGAFAQIADGRIYIGADPSQPHIGDLRISYHIAAEGPVSVIARQSGSGFAEYQTKAGDRLLMLRAGTLSAGEMFKAAEEENRILTWVLRLVGVVAMFIGWMLMMRPLVVLADVIPFLGNVIGAGTGVVALLVTAVVAPILIAIAWLWYRPLVSVGVLVLGFAIAYGIRMLAARRHARAAPAPA
ncbi:MAG TPA: TMEM43 family protein [Xanthobacteraceae bacterium]|nr:TMEM43 family protein [Xanthobacteraceae bacterium]